jgi:hypothetical protein
MMFDDLILKNIFVYLHNPKSRRAVSRVCRRWRKNCAYVAPLSSLQYWVNNGHLHAGVNQEHFVNELFDFAREFMGDILPFELVRAIMNNQKLVSTARRLTAKELARTPEHQLTLFSDNFKAPKSDWRRQMFRILFAFPIYQRNWYNLFECAIRSNKPYEVRQILKLEKKTYNLSDSPIPIYSFRVLFVHLGLDTGNVKLSQLYVNDARFNTSAIHTYFNNLCKRGYSPIVRMFLKQRPELDINYNNGEFLFTAIENVHYKVVALLLADPRLLITQDDEILEAAVACKSKKILQAIVDWHDK